MSLTQQQLDELHSLPPMKFQRKLIRKLILLSRNGEDSAKYCLGLWFSKRSDPGDLGGVSGPY